MLNFAEQTGSGAVTVVWSFLIISGIFTFVNIYFIQLESKGFDILRPPIISIDKKSMEAHVDC